MNLKATLSKADMSVYRLAKEIGRKPQQLYNYTGGKTKMSPMMDEKIRKYFLDHSIEVIED